MNHSGMDRRWAGPRRQAQLSPTRDRTLPEVDPVADALARVYALILSWPLPEEDERALHQDEEAE